MIEYIGFSKSMAIITELCSLVNIFLNSDLSCTTDHADMKTCVRFRRIIANFLSSFQLPNSQVQVVSYRILEHK